MKILIAIASIASLIEAIIQLIVTWVHYDNCEYGVLVMTVDLFHVTAILVINAGLYKRIWLVARRQTLQIEAQTPHSNIRKTIDKTTIMVFVIVILTYILWMPYFLGQICIYFLRDKLDNGRAGGLSGVTSILGFSTCIINNVVYAALNKDFKAAYKN